MKYDRVYNFSAGPATIPTEVLEQARDEMLNLNGSGMSVMEMSHRSKEFTAVIEAAEQNVRDLLGNTDDFHCMFLQGGASQQFAQIPMNFAQGKVVDMIHTGQWTKKATAEIKKCAEVRFAANTEDKTYTYLPKIEALDLSADSAYVHMCANNTIYGTQFKSFPKTGKVPLVCDMSSEMLSRPLDMNDFGIIFAGTQKNLGPAGMSVVLMRKDLAEQENSSLPSYWQYKTHAEAGSCYNTPPTFSVYMLKLMTDWIKGKGGLEGIQKLNDAKANKLYAAIDGNDFYSGPIAKEDRSPMNVVFKIAPNAEENEAKFVKEATAAGLTNLKGHRSIGGLRASIYNSQPAEGVDALIDFIGEFAKKNS